MARILAVLCVLLVAGCAGDAREDSAGQAAQRFTTAISSGDLAAACVMLAPLTRDDLLNDAADCAEALGSEQLPASPVGEVSIWGDRAQVRTDTDVLFLAEFEDGWRVVAAGCQPRGELPYRCRVNG
jgi:hypothetical protein